MEVVGGPQYPFPSWSRTSTGLVVYELQSRGAVTLKSNDHVLADV